MQRSLKTFFELIINNCKKKTCAVFISTVLPTRDTLTHVPGWRPGSDFSIETFSTNGQGW